MEFPITFFNVCELFSFQSINYIQLYLLFILGKPLINTKKIKEDIVGINNLDDELITTLKT